MFRMVCIKIKIKIVNEREVLQMGRMSDLFTKEEEYDSDDGLETRMVLNWRGWLMVILFFVVGFAIIFIFLSSYVGKINQQRKIFEENRVIMVDNLVKEWNFESMEDKVLSVEEVILNVKGNVNRVIGADAYESSYQIQYGYRIYWQRGNNVYYLTLPENQVKISTDSKKTDSSISFDMNFLLLFDDNEMLFKFNIDDIQSLTECCVTSVFLTNVNIIPLKNDEDAVILMVKANDNKYFDSLPKGFHAIIPHVN